MWSFFTRISSLCALVPSICSELGNYEAMVVHKPALPPSYPLAVRNPYLSTWMPSDRVKHLPTADPQFWTGQDLTWSVIVRVDGRTYSLMGVRDSIHGVRPAVVREAEFTATHSIFTLSAGAVNFTLDFFSPVAPSNYLRQSLPFSYLTVSVSGGDANHVQVYTDIDGRWTGKSESTARAFEQDGDLAMYSLSLADRHLFKYAESRDMALWGEAILASRSSTSSNLTFASGRPRATRAQFAKHGYLTGRDAKWSGSGVVALAHDLGSVTGNQSVNFVVGYVREETINYLGQPYTGYYRATFDSVSKAVSHFLDDYDDALSESLHLDTQMVTLATEAAGSKYADIVALSTRQAYGGIDLTVPLATLNTSDVLAFIKELSSDGNANTIDVIMPAFPIYYVLDPEYIRLLLEPIMKYLAAGRWHLPYAIHDIGSHYPNATGHDDQRAEPMPIEECGNLLILMLAYTRATGDKPGHESTDWALQYLPVLQKYADYLVDNTINMESQLSSNDAAGPLANETNLAIKAAVALNAFGNMTGMTNYSDIGKGYAHLFFDDRLGTDANQTHFLLQYLDQDGEDEDLTQDSGWKIPYNLYPDLLLDLQTFPPEAYKMGETFFSSSSSFDASAISAEETAAKVRGEYGVPLDHRQDWAKSDWNMWTAGTFQKHRHPTSPSTSTSTSVSISARDEFVNDLWSFMTNGKHNWPFSDRYVSTSANGAGRARLGVPVLCRARPTVGGHFALLALEGAGILRFDSPSTGVTRIGTSEGNDAVGGLDENGSMSEEMMGLRSGLGQSILGGSGV